MTSTAATGAAPRPRRVQRHDDRREVEITWADGSVDALPYDELRGYCPCAGCQGHMVREVRFRPPRSTPQPLVISPVGNYALSVLWSDGHSTGIYRFDFLAALPERIRRRREMEAREAAAGAEAETPS